MQLSATDTMHLAHATNKQTNNTGELEMYISYILESLAMYTGLCTLYLRNLKKVNVLCMARLAEGSVHLVLDRPVRPP